MLAAALLLVALGQEGGEELPVLRVGESIEGEISDNDPQVHTPTLDANFANAPTIGRTYQLEVSESGLYAIALRSYFFDAYLVLQDADGVLLAEDDDGLIGMHSRIVGELEAGRRYRLEACALHGGRGPFELVLKRGPRPVLSPADRAALELADAERRVQAIEGGESEALALSLHGLGVLLWGRGAFEQARPHLERALAIREEVLGPGHSDTATSLTSLALVLGGQGDHATARSLHERALAIYEEVLGPKHRHTATVLNNLAEVFRVQGDYAAARSLHERALAIYEEVLGPEHPDTALSLNNLAAVLRVQGDYAAARPLFERALAIKEAVHGPDHPTTATSVGQLANILLFQGDYAAARPLYERALAIREEALGPEHPSTATSLIGLARLLRKLGDDAGARPLFERALAIREKVFGPKHLDTATTLSELGGVLRSLGDYSGARPLLERALAIREEVLGPEHPYIPKSLVALGLLLTCEGDYAGARPLYERALAIREEVFGPVHPDTATSLIQLAHLHHLEGDYAGARPLYESALAIREEVLGPGHPNTANSMRSLARLLRSAGDYAAARPLYERALATREEVFGRGHLQTMEALNDLAGQLKDEGDYLGALPLYERVLAIREEALGPAHTKTAESMNNLGLLLDHVGDYVTARRMHERALAIYEEVLGPEHRSTANSLNNLALVLEAQGDYAAARPLQERALAIGEKVLGPENPFTAITANNLARLLTDSGEMTDAWELVRRSERGRRDRIEATLASLSEGERYPYLAQLSWHLELQLSLARALDESAVRVDAYDALLTWKGRVGRLLSASRAQLAAGMDDSERALVEELHRSQAELSRLVLLTDIPDRAAHDRRLGELRDECARIERELMAWSGREHEAARFEELRAGLEPGAALIDSFAHHIYRSGGEGWSAERFTVWITRADENEPIELDLGPAADIEAAVQAFLADLVARRGIAVVEEDAVDPGDALRALLWDPLAAHLEGVETVFVSPDRALGTLPFETLPLEDGSLAIERFAFVYLQDASTLLRERQDTAKLDSLLAVGAVDFRKRADWDLVNAGSASQDLVAMTDIGLRGSFTDYWGKLPATGYESQVVVDMHEDAFDEGGRRLLLQGGDPSEKRLKHELPRHSVLHLATHGYFQPEGLPSMWEAAKNDAGRTELRMSDEARHLVGKHPGLLSGLVCAGANSKTDGGDDSYLTAEEVGWLDLSKAELVVLSACETGLGRAQSGEGLIGLRRAFRTAGAKTVISSLWSVKDESTADLMRDFYKNLWIEKMPRGEALRQAQLAMLKRNRIEHRDPLPATWGAFVLSGEWR